MERKTNRNVAKSFVKICRVEFYSELGPRFNLVLLGKTKSKSIYTMAINPSWKVRLL